MKWFRIFAPAAFHDGPHARVGRLLCRSVAGNYSAPTKARLVRCVRQGAEATRPVDLRTAALPRYQHVEARGRYDESRQILVDNMTNTDGRAGYFVITPLALAGALAARQSRLVPVGEPRRVAPVGVAGDARTVRGRRITCRRRDPVGQLSALRPPFPAVAIFQSRAIRVLHETSWPRRRRGAARRTADGTSAGQAPAFRIAPWLRRQWFGPRTRPVVIYSDQLRRAGRSQSAP